METTSYEYDYSTGSYPPPELCSRDGDNILGAQLSILYYFMFVFSLFGNGLVLFIIYRFEQLTSVTNILVLNLVMSSLIFMTSLPFMAVYMQLSNWIFGNAMCKIVGSSYYLGLYSSVLFLALLTFDQHLAVVYSVGSLQMRNQKYGVISCVVVWLVSGLACIKPMILYTTFFSYLDNKELCEEDPQDFPNIDASLLRLSGFYLQLFLFFIFPLLVIVYCYIRITITVVSSNIATKFKMVRLIFIIVLVFFMCWTPFNIVLLMYDKATTCVEEQKLGYALQISRNIASIYFCISPIFYTFVGKKFQNYFKRLLVKHFPKLKRHPSAS
ncbi:NACHT, LRR and PYD domains-containing protein 12 [Sarotherodon galilaeus]